MRARPLLALVLVSALAACASTPDTTPTPTPQERPRIKRATSTSILGAADRELRALFKDVAHAEKTFGDVLFAVNRVLFEHPRCVDVWFDEVARIDEAIGTVQTDAERFREALRIYHQALADSDIARIDLDDITRLRNQIGIRKDRIAELRPQLVRLIASAMRPGDPCPDVKP